MSKLSYIHPTVTWLVTYFTFGKKKCVFARGSTEQSKATILLLVLVHHPSLSNVTYTVQAERQFRAYGGLWGTQTVLCRVGCTISASYQSSMGGLGFGCGGGRQTTYVGGEREREMEREREREREREKTRRRRHISSRRWELEERWVTGKAR
jgi:hypothetical protein